MGKIEFVSHLVFHFVSLILEITKLKTKFLHFCVTGALFSFVCELKFCFLGEVFLAVLTQWLSCWSFHSTSHAWSAGWSFLWQIFFIVPTPTTLDYLSQMAFACCFPWCVDLLLLLLPACNDLLCLLIRFYSLTRWNRWASWSLKGKVSLGHLFSFHSASHPF